MTRFDGASGPVCGRELGTVGTAGDVASGIGVAGSGGTVAIGIGTGADCATATRAEATLTAAAKKAIARAFLRIVSCGLREGRVQGLRRTAEDLFAVRL